MDNRTIARHLKMMANLYEIERDRHPQAARYRGLAENVRVYPYALRDALDQFQEQSQVTEEELQSLFNLTQHGVKIAFFALPVNIPISLREVLALNGVGPKIARLLFKEGGIKDLQDLKKSVDSGSILSIQGISSHLIEVLPEEISSLERRRTLIPLALGLSVAQNWRDTLLSSPLFSQVRITGELSLQHPLLHSVELLADALIENVGHAVKALSEMGFNRQTSSIHPLHTDWFAEYYFLMDEDDRQIPIRIYLTTPERFYTAHVITSGDDAHANWLRILDSTSDLQVSCEADVYSAKSLPYIPPELREGKSFYQHQNQLLTYQDIQGDLHMHSTYSDGADSMEDMIRGCIACGYQYMVITDHSKSLHVANGLTVDRLKRQHEELLMLREKYPEIVILHGSEVDILADGALDFEEEVLSWLDLVVASIHTSMYKSKAEQTARILAAIQSPHVDIIGHPTGRMLGRRDSYPLDFEQIFQTATDHRLALELNSNPYRLDLDPDILRLALDAGCLFAVDSDSHCISDLGRIPKYGIPQAMRGWLTPTRVINTWDWSELKNWLHTE